MFCATVSEGSRLKAWKTNPIRSRRRIVSLRSLSRARSVSPSATVPEVGRSSPAATLRNVLLPEPEGPMIAVNEPRGSVDADAVEGDDRAVAFAVDLADVAKRDRGSGGGRSRESGELTGAWNALSRSRRGRSHPGCPRPRTPAAGAARGGQPYRARLAALG